MKIRIRSFGISCWIQWARSSVLFDGIVTKFKLSILKKLDDYSWTCLVSLKRYLRGRVYNNSFDWLFKKDDKKRVDFLKIAEIFQENVTSISIH